MLGGENVFSSDGTVLEKIVVNDVKECSGTRTPDSVLNFSSKFCTRIITVGCLD